ncbi:DnaB helicase C-terminal domain-containing protein [bacterium]|nr:DnaB helicase C-terminal domain-containing protein [bacterium]
MKENQRTLAISDINIPEDSSAEKAAIGSLIEGAWKTHIGSVPEDWFNGKANIDILRAINALTASGVSVNIETLKRELSKISTSQVQNWFSYLDDCIEQSAGKLMFDYYRGILIDKANARHWHKLSLEVLSEIASGESAEVFAEKLTQELTCVLSKEGIKSLKPEAQRIEECYKEVVEMSQGKQQEHGIQLGFNRLDSLIQGLHPGNVVIIGARPSVGKSALAFEMLLNMIDNGIPCGLFSLEMRYEDFIRRAFANLANLSMSNVRNGGVTSSELTRLRAAADRLKAGPLFVDDIPKTIPQMRAQARLWAEFKGVKCIVIDYIQLCKMGGRSNSRYEEICDISQNIKQMAMELELPVIVLAQLNREAEKADKPTLSSLKDSGQIEQDADVVILLKRNGSDDHEFDRKEITAFVDKNRQGQTGEVCFVFDGRFMRFQEKGYVA